MAEAPSSKFFTLEQAAEYCVKQVPDFFADSSKVKASEIGNGNLNYVWKVSDGDKSLIVKQAPPFIRCVGESWPLTIDRARIEAESLIEMGKACPDYTVKVFGYDEKLGAMVMEDLSSMEVLRDAQIAGKWFPKCSQQLATWIAEVAFSTSDFSMESDAKHKMIAKFSNPELCTTTNAVFFVQPWTTHEMNNHEAYLKPTIEKMRANDKLRLAVARLQAKFNSSAQCLVHGDLHTGSIFVSEDSCIKVFDTEFAYIGPLGFDLGLYIAHLLLNCASKVAAAESADAKKVLVTKYCKEVIDFMTIFREEFMKKVIAAKSASEKPGVIYEFCNDFVDEVLQDAFGFAGTDVFRRTVGISHVDDVDKMESEEAKKSAREISLKFAEQLLCISLQAKPSLSAEDLTAKLF